MSDISKILDRLERIENQLKHTSPEDLDIKIAGGQSLREMLIEQKEKLFESLKNINSDEYKKQQRERVRAQENRTIFYSGIVIVFSLITLILSGCWAYPNYNVWKEAKYGEAELKKAEWNRQIAVKEAEAKYNSAIQLANAEIERAKGVAESNKIIGDSLKNNESYLRYLWINNMQNNKNNQVIYVPSEAGLPILEAGRLSTNKKDSGNE